MLVLVLAPTGLSPATSVFRRSLQKRTNTNNNKILRAPYCVFCFFVCFFFLHFFPLLLHVVAVCLSTVRMLCNLQFVGKTA